MNAEDILRLIDDYEVVVEGKVSQAAFPYPPMKTPPPDFRAGGIIPSSGLISIGDLNQWRIPSSGLISIGDLNQWRI